MSSSPASSGVPFGLAIAAAGVLLGGSLVATWHLRVDRDEAAVGKAHTKDLSSQGVVGDSRATPGPNRASFAELAALALAEGVQLDDPRSSTTRAAETAAGAESSVDRRALFALLRTGLDSDALKAIREFARLGGPANCVQLAAIMKDEGWSDAVRTAAALALMKRGSAADGLLAVRSLGVIGGNENTANLTAIIKDETTSESLRVEAALALGNVGTAEAGDALIAAFEIFKDPDTQEQLLDSLGRFPFRQIEETWKDFLADPNTPDDLRVAAVEALGHSTAESVEYLQSLAATDRDPRVREEAAWALSVQARDGTIGSELARMAIAEPEADVRRRLYEALLTQQQNTAETLLPQIRQESDVAARVAGFNAIADAVKRGQSGTLVSEFNSAMVPELQQIALSSNSVNLRMRAVFALRRAGTDISVQALRVISETPNPKIAQAAMNGLRHVSK